MVNADRCMKLLEIPQERTGDIKLLAGRDSWPERGEMEFKNVSLRYRPTTEIVIDNLSFKLQPGEKIGVVVGGTCLDVRPWAVTVRLTSSGKLRAPQVGAWRGSALRMRS